MGGSAPPRKTDQALAQQMDDGLVILNPESGEYYTLNEVGARVWELVDGARTREAIIELICAEYDADETDVRRDVDDLLAELKEEKLIDDGPPS